GREVRSPFLLLVAVVGGIIFKGWLYVQDGEGGSIAKTQGTFTEGGEDTRR
ncbi:hypothetical protein B0J14DRAFT_511880, partial [Halenospora varia]